MSQQPPAICIMGPTASGKTSLALEIAQQIPAEIISVDSALIYRQMDIGTSKPDPAERQAVPHYLIDICDPAESYSAAQFREDALQLMAKITSRDKIPMLVGGTMLYYRALFAGLSNLPSADPQTRAALEARMAEFGSQALHAELAKIDPIAAKQIHPNDPQRIQRALEVYEITGRPISQWWAEQKQNTLPYDAVKIATMPGERSKLHQIIAQRFDAMLEQGLVEEVRSLKERGDLDLNKPSMRCVNYRQVWEYLDNVYDFDIMREKGIAATRQLAKRQLTWLRRESDVNWVTTATSQSLQNSMALIAKVYS